MVKQKIFSGIVVKMLTALIFIAYVVGCLSGCVSIMDMLNGKDEEGVNDSDASGGTSEDKNEEQDANGSENTNDGETETNQNQNQNQQPSKYVPESKFNAWLDSYVNDYVSESFYDENRVRAYYDIKDAFGNDVGSVKEKDAPSERMFVLNSQAEFDEIFVEYPEQIDFENRTAILIIFTSCILDTTPYFISEISEESKKITVRVDDQSSHDGDVYDSVMLYGRCMLLVINKMEIEEVMFKDR